MASIFNGKKILIKKTVHRVKAGNQNEESVEFLCDHQKFHTSKGKLYKIKYVLWICTTTTTTTTKP